MVCSFYRVEREVEGEVECAGEDDGEPPYNTKRECSTVVNFVQQCIIYEFQVYLVAK